MTTIFATTALSCLLLAGCSRSDTVHAKNDARETGKDIKRELHKAGQEIKQDLHKAGQEIDKAAKDVKREVNEKTDKK